MTRAVLTLVTLAFLVTACGKVGPLELPPDEPASDTEEAG